MEAPGGASSTGGYLTDRTSDSSPISPEVTVVVRAQQIVDRWQHARHDGFADDLAVALAEPWDEFMAIDNHRLAVQRVAEAIHAGIGHGFHDQEPLLAIARETFRAP